MVIGDIRLVEKRGGRQRRVFARERVRRISQRFYHLDSSQIACGAARPDFPEHSFSHAESPEAWLTGIADADVAFSAQSTPEHMARAARLRWVHSPAAGVGGMLFPAMVTSP